jgi:hypothetical protein
MDYKNPLGYAAPYCATPHPRLKAGLPEWTAAPFLGLSNVSRTPRWLLAPRVRGVQRRLK